MVRVFGRIIINALPYRSAVKSAAKQNQLDDDVFKKVYSLRNRRIYYSGNPLIAPNHIRMRK